MRYAVLVCLCLNLWIGHPAHAATPERVYHVAMTLASQGRQAEAIAALQAAAALLPEQNLWQARMLAAATLLQLRQHQQWHIPRSTNPNLELARKFAQQHPHPMPASTRITTTLAMLLPGAGHWFLGRHHDAMVAFWMVMPMFLLSVWAWRRRMGPVTVFFVAITLWLWSGTIFSAISLSERGNFEAYTQWWQHVWQAAALSGRPW